MTASYDPYTDPEAFEAAVGRLADPLNDPLPAAAPGSGPGPGSEPAPVPGPDRPGPDRPGPVQGPPATAQGTQPGGVQGSPWFRPHADPAPPATTAPPATSAPPNGTGAPAPPPAAASPAAAPSPAAAEAPTARFPAAAPPQRPGGALPRRPAPPGPAPSPGPAPRGPVRRGPAPGGPVPPTPGPSAGPRVPPPASPSAPTTTAPVVPQPGPPRPAAPHPDGPHAEDPQTVALRQAVPADDRPQSGRTDAGPPSDGGRAARRKAAERAARARKDPPGVIASRIVGELFITTGVLLLLFVTYQLWWTNVQANMQANGAASKLEKSWEAGGADRRPDAFTPGTGFALMYIPKLDVRVPVAEGIDKASVLDRGMAGHYDAKSGLKTAMPWDKQGNFAVAAHRNTHGEPFRYINRLEPGDKIVVETKSTYYTYEMTSQLPVTPPSNVDVVSEVPQQSGFTKPGRYVTLTTCTPEFTSKYRLIVWGKMVDERPRSKGKPDALVE